MAIALPNEESIGAVYLVGPREPQRTYGEDRICDAPDCGTFLSIYNPQAYCSVHAREYEATWPRRRQRRRSPSPVPA